MRLGRGAICILLAASVLVTGACAMFPFSLLPFWKGSGTPEVLARCDPNPTVLCLVSFGLNPPDQMLISLFVPPSDAGDFHVRVTYKGKETVYPCVFATDFPATVYCTGEVLPLGATIGIEAYTGKGNIVLARGHFELNGFAMPTVPVGSELTPQPPGTGAPTPSGSPATTPRPSPSVTPRPARSATPKPAGSAYPNP